MSGPGVMSVFHAGERAVQRRAGVERTADRVGAGIASWVAPEFAGFLREQPFVVVPGRDDDKRIQRRLPV